MGIGRIFYLIPPNEKPCGGIQTRYLHCQYLNDLGFKAYPLHRTETDITWFNHGLTVLATDKIGYRLNPNDVVVANEVMPYEALLFKSAFKVMFVQSWPNVYRVFYEPKWYEIKTRLNRSFRAGLKRKDHNRNYYDLGYNIVLSNSQYNTNYLKRKMGVDAITVTNRIDLERFSYDPLIKKEGKILALARRNLNDCKKIQSLLNVINPGNQYEWNIVDGLHQDQLVSLYKQADVFLATGYPEGIPRPPLEAMACGCVVVGFTGGGGLEYMIDGETAMVAEDGDCETAARKLDSIIRDKELKETIRINGVKKSKEFDLNRYADDLKAVYTSISETISRNLQ